MFNKSNTFVINLDHRTDRLARTEREFSRIGWEFTRFPAVNKATIQSDDPRYDPGHVACFKSHRSVWGLAAARNLQYVAIFEDDVIFADDFDPEFYKFWYYVPENWDFIHLGPYFGARIATPSSNVDIIDTHKPQYWGVHAYFLKTNALHRLLSYMDMDAVDTYLFKICGMHNITVYTPQSMLACQYGDDGDLKVTDQNDFVIKMREKLIKRELS